MQMSDKNKENWKYLIGSVGAISLLALTMLGQQYVYETREQNRKIDAMYDYILVQGVRDSARNVYKIVTEGLKHGEFNIEIRCTK